MGNAQFNSVDVTQSFYNNITQANQQNCIATSNTSQSGNVIIINGDKINGNFGGVVNDISTDASCTITSSMEDIVQDILQAQATQTNSAENDMFGDFSVNAQDSNFDVSQFTVNNISQINEANCTASSVVSQNGNYVYVSNSTINGNFLGVSNKSSTNANCVMSNVMKNSTYNSAQASADQSNSSKGMFVAMSAAIVAIIVLAVVIVIVMFITGALKPKPNTGQDMQAAGRGLPSSSVPGKGLPPSSTVSNKRVPVAAGSVPMTRNDTSFRPKQRV